MCAAGYSVLARMQDGGRAAPLRRPLRRSGVAGLLLIGLCTSHWGCARAPAPAEPREAGAALAPRAVVQRLIDLRAAARYRDMAPLILEPHRRAVCDTLLAVDDFLTANRQLCDYLREHVGLEMANSVDQSHLGENLSVFSRYVDLLDATVDADAARVAFTIDRRLPAGHVDLRRVGGQWQYDPGAGFAPELPLAFHKMAAGLRRMREELAAGAIPVAEIRNDSQRLAREVQLRLIEGVRMLPAPGKPAGAP